MVERRDKRFYVAEVLIAVAFLCVLYTFVYNHELTHAIIFRNYGHASEIYFSPFISVTITTNQTRNVTQAELLAMTYQTTELEIEGVNTQNNIFITFVFISIINFLCYIYSDKEVKQCLKQ